MKNQIKLLFTGSTIYGKELSDVATGIQMSVIFIGSYKLDSTNGGSENEQRKINI